ncbi:TolC family protein [Herbaspirillum sp. LeCh32-8]|uniref:TolC family protein n=1 Tax=Herbaspirillum sp. LeCh32-8 TaxID=2821356 RepID=UPI001AE5EF5A|nr:TolC family protein [Herbaspirillum sp. LeCh32-8]MBP0600213.1 TolC family protein [Herbaspirillum sp. LeCh32-8]
MIPFASHPLRAGVLVACALLAGCAQLSQDGGFGRVQDISAARLGAAPAWNRTPADARRAEARVHQLLPAGRLASADDAVQIALINNPELQAAFAELGVAEADLVQAGRLSNPGFSFARTHAGGDIKIERSLTLGLMQLITLPAASRIEARRFEQVRLQLAARVLATAAQTRQAYYKALAAQQGLAYQEQVEQAAEAAHELTAKMAERGNVSRLDAAREQLFYAETQTRLQRARREAQQDKETLARLLGMPPAFTLPDRLPALPKQIEEAIDVERQAVEQRLDVLAARTELEGLQGSLGLSRATRFINVLDLGALRTTETGKAPEIGYQIDIEIPLFDWGQARVAKAEAIYLQGANRLAAAALDARAQARLAWRERQDAYALARRYRDGIVPLRQRMSEENLLRYNGMLISVFDLLADAREQAATVNAAIDAERDFWIADAALQLALGGPVNTANPQGIQP